MTLSPRRTWAFPHMPDQPAFTAPPLTRFAPEPRTIASTPVTRLAPHPSAITETTRTVTLTVDIGRTAAGRRRFGDRGGAAQGNRTVNIERRRASRHRLAGQDGSTW
jgi:hypothetical protein